MKSTRPYPRKSIASNVPAVSVHEHTIAFHGIITDGLRSIARTLYQETIKYDNIILDFRELRFVDPSISTPLLSEILRFKEESGNKFRVIEPMARDIKRVLISQNFFHFIDPDNFEPSVKTFDYNLPIARFYDYDQQYNAVDEAVERIIQCLPDLRRSQMSALEWALTEITENVLSHAESSGGGILQVVSFPNRHKVGFYVADNGIGIPESMRRSGFVGETDTQLIYKALEEGVTSKKGAHQGNGLYGTIQCCKVSKGEFSIHSNYATAEWENGQLRVKKETIPFRGTFVKAVIQYATDELLSKALIFKGKPHIPNDYIDLNYGTEEEKILFVMKDEGSVFGSRPQGRRIANKIEVISDQLTSGLIIDFEGVNIISASFADEVFGKMNGKYGKDVFETRVKMRNMSQEIRNIINRAIGLRASEHGENQSV